MRKLNLFAIFHLNLAFSSIEVEQRATVVECCYWPLLRLVRKHRVPVGIEASGFTLEEVAQIDPEWIAELRLLVDDGLVEFVGAGYSQLIGPLVPAEVNDANLRVGHEVYERMLGKRPTIALVNEQAYSAGLIESYLAAGYDALFMEWDNPAMAHPEWDATWRYHPQVACGQHGERIAVLWNHSTSFQKFQRYVHGDMDLGEYMTYISSHIDEGERLFPVYGNDIEIFDFRPGRFEAEAVIEHNEWDRIDELLERIAAHSEFAWRSARAALDMTRPPNGGRELSLESPALPVPVKKQGKYNITRWAVTGRDDLGINTRCHRLADRLTAGQADDLAWKELCYLWSSDFRTHITQSRWDAYLERLVAFEKLWPAMGTTIGGQSAVTAGDSVEHDGRFLRITTAQVAVALNARRGLAIERLAFDGDIPLVGTLPHGHYDDISMTADYYSGHVVLERVGQHKIADLSAVEPIVTETSTDVVVEATVQTPLGPILKRIRVAKDSAALSMEYSFDWSEVPAGSLRLGHITLLPGAFSPESLRYSTHNGGRELESFALGESETEHGRAVSLQVTAATGLGMTRGIVEIGDDTRGVRLEVDTDSAALIGLMTFRRVADSYFCRLALSALELDESRKGTDAPSIFPGPIRLSITPL